MEENKTLEHYTSDLSIEDHNNSQSPKITVTLNGMILLHKVKGYMFRAIACYCHTFQIQKNINPDHLNLMVTFSHV